MVSLLASCGQVKATTVARIITSPRQFAYVMQLLGVNIQNTEVLLSCLLYFM